MGLDSVELVMTIEDKFGICIPDNEYQNISTVQQMADAIFERLTLAPNHKCLSQIIFYRIRKAFEEFGNHRNDILPSTRMIDLLNSDNLKSDWSKLEDHIGLQIPKLIYPLNKEVRLLGFKIFDRTEPIAENSIRKLTDWIISMNSDKLISVDNISSKHEVERIICGIIETHIGIPISEIEMHHSFTNDLGID